MGADKTARWIAYIIDIKGDPNPTACSFRWFIVAKSTVRWFVVREKHCWMAADSAE
jgi:hypothetical protein